ncbi:MAG: NAD-binding protein [Candidatus Altiarchaeota archaeon]|nr:NAD-binding protein [Candidatus Altiarchaeota archaeon]
MYIIVVGGGTMGRHIAAALPEHEVTVIELNPDKAKRIADEMDVKVVVGNASRLYIMKKAEFERADAVVAVTNNDEVNMFISLYAIKKGKKAVARVHESEFIEVFNDLGIENIISPEQRAAMDISKKLVWT